MNEAVDPPAHTSVARSAAGRQGRKTVGPAPADTSGTHLTLAAFALHVCSSGWKRNVSPAITFRHTLIGTQKTEPAILHLRRMLADDSSAPQSSFHKFVKDICDRIRQLQLVADLNKELGVFSSINICKLDLSTSSVVLKFVSTYKEDIRATSF
ncbi:MAG TPA: hypothetical protein VFW31_01520 [Candidatus Angelobacter sp.]|nr:hypothetical protein [Candidatus Angelobacter sp.]